MLKTMWRRFWILAAAVPLALAIALPSAATSSEASLPARLEVLASAGNAEAAYHLGMIYHLGLEGVASDPRRAFEFFQRAAYGGDALGAYKVGCFYAGQGDGVVDENPDEALRYKLIAAESGYLLAQTDVAQIYASRGDERSALRWFDAAARQGSWDALFMAFFRVMPNGRNPDPARAWLYVQVMNRTLGQLPVGDLSSEEREMFRDAQTQLQQLVEAGLSEADRAEGERLLAEWHVSRSPASLRADLGLDAARRLVEGGPAG